MRDLHAGRVHRRVNRLAALVVFLPHGETFTSATLAQDVEPDLERVKPETRHEGCPPGDAAPACPAFAR
jgi:hypothetical protein